MSVPGCHPKCSENAIKHDPECRTANPQTAEVVKLRARVLELEKKLVVAEIELDAAKAEIDDLEDELNET